MSARGKHGGPITFRCTGCRKLRLPWPKGSALAVQLTGRQRPGYEGKVALEYRCTDCHHIGWSGHGDLHRKLPKLVEWQHGFKSDSARGTCIEVRRDKDHTWAYTLCNHFVILPGPSKRGGSPTCKACLEIIAKR